MKRHGMRALSTGVVLVATACGGGSPAPAENSPPEQFGTVRGTVSAAGNPIAGATVALSRAGTAPRTAQSGANGDFQFTQVATGAWNLGITPPTGYTVAGSASASVTVTANQVATANFTLEAGPAQGNTVEVSAQDNTFSPNSVTIAVNTTIRWRNAGYTEHNSTGAAGTWASPNLAPGASYDRLFTQQGTYNYSCTLHAGMTGTITVQ
jgi:plastocyanin